MKNELTVNSSNITKKAKKYKNKTFDTIICNDFYFDGIRAMKYGLTSYNFILNKIPLGYFRHNTISLINIKSNNIYIGDKVENEGINVTKKYIDKYKISRIILDWDSDKELHANLDKINIIYDDKTFNINLNKEELKKIFIETINGQKEDLDITIRNKNSYIKYYIRNGIMIEEITSIYFTKYDLNNGKLDLTKYNKFDVMSFGDLEVDTLIINKEDICKLEETNIFEDFFIRNIKVIDKNEMKLNPINIIPFNDELDCVGKYIIGEINGILIYVDSRGKLNVFDKEKILEDEKIDDVIFLRKKDDYIVIYKYKEKDKYKVIIDGIEYSITKLFIFYIKENLYRFVFKHKDVLNNTSIDYFGILKYIFFYDFETLYNEYIEFKYKLKELFNKGFKYEYFKYLDEKGLSNLIIKMCEIDINKYSNEEINELNCLGRKYIKKKSR